MARVQVPFPSWYATQMGTKQGRLIWTLPLPPVDAVTVTAIEAV